MHFPINFFPGMVSAAILISGCLPAVEVYQQCGQCSLSVERQPAKINHQPPSSLRLPVVSANLSSPLLNNSPSLHPPSSLLSVPLAAFSFSGSLSLFPFIFFSTIHMSCSTFSHFCLSSRHPSTVTFLFRSSLMFFFPVVQISFTAALFFF